MGKKITLYHGSIHEFDAIDITKGKPFKDFGAGFYASPNKKHSAGLALRNKQVELMRISQRKRRSRVNAWVYVYELDLSRLGGLNVKEFPKADSEWMRFVVSNRNNKERLHNYDVVTGPTANDDTRASIQAFFAGAYGDINSGGAIDILINMIKPYQLPTQYFFGSQKAAGLLLFQERFAAE